MNLDQVLDAKGVGAQLGVSPYTVQWWRRRGLLHGVKVAERVWIFPVEEVERLAKEREATRLARTG